MKRRCSGNHTIRHAFLALGVSWIFAVAALTPSLAGTPKWGGWEDMDYSGRCGVFLLSPRPSQRIWYRFYLQNWRYGDERDFSCFMQEY